MAKQTFFSIAVMMLMLISQSTGRETFINELLERQPGSNTAIWYGDENILYSVQGDTKTLMILDRGESCKFTIMQQLGAGNPKSISRTFQCDADKGLKIEYTSGWKDNINFSRVLNEQLQKELDEIIRAFVNADNIKKMEKAIDEGNEKNVERVGKADENKIGCGNEKLDGFQLVYLRISVTVLYLATIILIAISLPKGFITTQKKEEEDDDDDILEV